MKAGSERPQVLIPFDRHEALTVGEAARVTGRTTQTMRAWAARADLGRRIGGRWYLSRVALAMYLDGDRRALRSYLAGDRDGPLVRSFVERLR